MAASLNSSTNLHCSCSIRYLAMVLLPYNQYEFLASLLVRKSENFPTNLSLRRFWILLLSPKYLETIYYCCIPYICRVARPVNL